MVRNKVRKRRSTKPIDADRVIAIIQGISNIDELTWELVAAHTPYNERSLRRVDRVYEAFWNQKDVLSVPARKAPRSSEKIESDTITYLRDMLAAKDKIIEHKDEMINNYRQAFVQLIEDANKEGVDIERRWTVSIEKVLSNKKSVVR